jgi:hypothetical protein
VSRNIGQHLLELREIAVARSAAYYPLEIAQEDFLQSLLQDRVNIRKKNSDHCGSPVHDRACAPVSKIRND